MNTLKGLVEFAINNNTLKQDFCWLLTSNVQNDASGLSHKKLAKMDRYAVKGDESVPPYCFGFGTKKAIRTKLEDVERCISKADGIESAAAAWIAYCDKWQESCVVHGDYVVDQYGICYLIPEVYLKKWGKIAP